MINKTLEHNTNMNIIDLTLQELQKTWGYSTEELNDIRDKMQELANTCFWEGYHEASNKEKSFTSYGKSEDYE